MNTQYTATIKQDGEWWIGWIEEIKGVNAQETTKEELIESLREALKDILELNREETCQEAAENHKEFDISTP